MKENLVKFIRTYGKALQQGDAAIFAGAGLSVPSGFVNWRELMRNFAQDIQLDINKEQDLIAVAQYYTNEMGGNRGDLNQEIISQFTKNHCENLTLNEICSLPIKVFWTTNYDHLIEDTLRNKENKKVDVKINQENLALTLPNADTTVYKFHGDIIDPANAVITKDDYDLFDKSHNLFIAALQGDLISKTFVFIGYSFNDPDLHHILSKIKILLGHNKRTHYWIEQKIKKNENMSDEEFEYLSIKQELIIKDLARYGIYTILVGDYNNLPFIFKHLQKNYITNSIFVAGSCRNYGNWTEKDAYFFMSNLGYSLVKEGYSISSGNIEGVGPAIINGALTAINELQVPIEKYLSIKTLPLINGKDSHMKPEAKTMFQNNMISKAGIIIFLFGNNYYNGKLLSSRGVMHDFERAIKANKYVIPIGSTGFASKDILDIIVNDIDKYAYLKPYINKLLDETNSEKLITLILTIIQDIRDCQLTI
jgi:hypothetical protein